MWFFPSFSQLQRSSFICSNSSSLKCWLVFKLNINGGLIFKLTTFYCYLSKNSESFSRASEITANPCNATTLRQAERSCIWHIYMIGHDSILIINFIAILLETLVAKNVDCMRDAQCTMQLLNMATVHAKSRSHGMHWSYRRQNHGSDENQVEIASDVFWRDNDVSNME